MLSEIPPDEIYIIPVRLDNCTPRHEQLREIQWVDLSPLSYDGGLEKIMRALDSSGVLARNPDLITAASAKDLTSLRMYRMLFDRPAFCYPCVFESALLEVEDATKDIAAAMGTGSLFSRDVRFGDNFIVTEENIDGKMVEVKKTLLARVTPIGDFESERYRDELSKIRNFLTGIQRTVKQLINFLEDADGKLSRQLPKNSFHHMEFMLRELIASGVSHNFIKQAFSLMDQIDSERNYVLGKLNILLNGADIALLPLITLSSEQLGLSEKLELNNGEGPQLWDLFYLRTHRLLRPFLKYGPRALPLSYPQLPEPVIGGLKQLGLQSINDLCHLSREELERRDIAEHHISDIEKALSNRGLLLAGS